MQEITTLNAPEAEEYLLNACCKDYLKVLPLLPTNFCDMLDRQDNKTIFSAIQRLVKKGIQPDVGTVAEELYATKSNVSVHILMRDPFKPINLNPEQINYYINRVKDCYTNRLILNICQQSIIDIQNGTPPEDYIKSLMSGITNTVKQENDNDTQSTKELVHEYIERLKNDDVVDDRLLFPYNAMNAITSGMGKGELMVLAGRPAMGKTFVVIDLMLKLSQQGKRIVYFDLELQKAEYTRRVVSALGNLNAQHLKYSNAQREKLPQQDKSSFTVGIAEADFWAYEMEEIVRHERRRTRESICNMIRADNLKKPIDLVVVDHIGRILASSKHEDKRETISEATKDIHDVCKELGVPLIITSQINRGGSDDTKPPTLEHLKDSGTLEEDADYVNILYRPHYYTHEECNKYSLQMHFDKNRSGEPSVCTLKADMSRNRMQDGKKGICNFDDFETEPLDKKSPEAKEAKALFQKKK